MLELPLQQLIDEFAEVKYASNLEVYKHAKRATEGSCSACCSSFGPEVTVVRIRSRFIRFCPSCAKELKKAL